MSAACSHLPFRGGKRRIPECPWLALPAYTGLFQTPLNLYQPFTSPLQRALYLMRAGTRYPIPRGAALSHWGKVPCSFSSLLPRKQPPAAASRSEGSRPLHPAVDPGKLWRGYRGRAAVGCTPSPFPSTPTCLLTCAPHQAMGTRVKAPSPPLDGDRRWFNDAVLENGDKNPLIRGRRGHASSFSWYLASKVSHTGGWPWPQLRWGGFLLPEKRPEGQRHLPQKPISESNIKKKIDFHTNIFRDEMVLNSQKWLPGRHSQFLVRDWVQSQETITLPQERKWFGCLPHFGSWFVECTCRRQ